jgi:hypothetical protein
MSRQWVRGSDGCVGRAIATFLVLGVVNVSVPAFAGQVASEQAPPTSSTAGVTIPPPVMSLAAEASGRIPGAFERAVTAEARHLDLAEQGSSTGDSSGHWCAGGLVLLAGGVAAAVISGVRRNTNPQKPSPPVGVVLGTSAAAVGGIMMIKACKR